MRDKKAVGLNKPRKLSLVKFKYGEIPKRYWSRYPFSKRGVYVYLGELANMPGHCVVADHPSGKLYSGYHTENFIEVSDDEEGLY